MVSRSGAEWAAQAVNMLGIEDYVDLAIDKPSSLYDDKSFEEAFPNIQFIKNEGVSADYKSLKKQTTITQRIKRWKNHRATALQRLRLDLGR